MDKAILLVDDEAIILMALRQELRSKLGNNYRYETARDAKEALDVFDELSKEGIKVVLIISDWIMPDIKGDDFLRVARERYPDVKTILVSGHTDMAHLDELKNSGALDAFFLKPWNSKLLVDECKRLLAFEEHA